MKPEIVVMNFTHVYEQECFLSNSHFCWIDCTDLMVPTAIATRRQPLRLNTVWHHIVHMDCILSTPVTIIM